MQFASCLRIDHVMWFNRLFWIPQGAEAREGVYVHYPAEELYAILCLESHRHQTVVVGEDLGTVPAYIRPQLACHGIYRMSAGPYEINPDTKETWHKIPARSVAYLNTHDMPTFASFWKGKDIAQRRRMKLLNSRMAQKEHRTRLTNWQNLVDFLRRNGHLKGKPTLFAVLKEGWKSLSKSPANLVLINLEDLWLETKPQNVPGTKKEFPNWVRKARYPLERFTGMKWVTTLLALVDDLRKKRR